jgi:two-component system OmpR family sensor kinase
MAKKSINPIKDNIDENNPDMPNITAEERLRLHIEDITHEIQIRLQAVLAHAENLAVNAKNIGPSEVERLANDLLNSVLTLDTVVQNLREYKENYRFRKQTIGSLLYQAKSMYEAEASRRGVTIQINLEDEAISPSALEISQRELQYAFNNLLYNAVKYSYSGSNKTQRHVVVTGRREKNFYRLCFENYGVGILQDEVESGIVFQSGYRGKLTKGEYRTGSGIGLFVAKRVIDKHHGIIELECKPAGNKSDPEGQPHLTRFNVYIPYEQPKRS